MPVLVGQLPDGKPEQVYDGALVGAGSKAFGPNTSLQDVPAVTPRNGKPSCVAIYVNGINNAKDEQTESMQALADAIGIALVGVHNATSGVARDTIQTAADKLGFAGLNKATPTIARLIWDQLEGGKPVVLIGHSQGTLVIAAAIVEVRDRLIKEKGMTRAQAETALGKIQVQTFGAAATIFPDGPQYRHYFNKADPIPTYIGLGHAAMVRAPTRERVGEMAGLVDRAAGWAGAKTNLKGAARSVFDSLNGYPGRDAVIIAFDDPATDLKATLAPHLLQTYLKHYKAVEDDIKK